MPALASFVIGLVFGIGLIVSGMCDPAKVLAFLDLAGAWDPSLAIVMGVAVPVTALGYALVRRRATPLAAPTFNRPAAGTIDRRLVLGSITFGVGWGMAGVCPGPALVVAAAGHVQGLVFVAALLAGMLVFELLQRARGPVPPVPTSTR